MALFRVATVRNQTMRSNVNLPSLSVARRLLFGLALLTSLVFSLASLLAAQMTGFNLTCGDSIGLIQAINQANLSSEVGTITLNPDHQADCVYTLTSPHNNTDGHNGLPSITSQIILEGEGATLERSSIAGTPPFRIFHVAANGNLTLNQVTVSNGRATSGSLPANAGGGIANFGTLNLINSIISGNYATNGGGLYNDVGGMLNLINSAVSYNSQASFGGGIFNQGRLSLADSIITGNSADLSGGGIANFGMLSLSHSTVSHNGQPGLGGGIFNQSTLNLANSTISGNSATRDGGGLFNDFGGTIYLADSIVSDNKAGRNGGGIFNFENGTLSLTRSTVSKNRGKGDAGGIYNHHHGRLSLIHATVNGNSANEAGGGIYNRSSAVLSLTYSTVNDNSAKEAGGGMANFGLLSLTKSTVSGNRAGRNGGGIFNNFQVLSLVDSTVSRNSAGQNGGGLFNRGELFLTTSIVTNSLSGGDCTNSGTLYSVNNLIGDGSCSLAFSDDARAEPLAVNSGSTETTSLTTGEPDQ
jgi:hypothetical protein